MAKKPAKKSPSIPPHTHLGFMGPAMAAPQSPGSPSDPMTQVRYLSSGKFGPPPPDLGTGPMMSVPPSLQRQIKPAARKSSKKR